MKIEIQIAYEYTQHTTHANRWLVWTDLDEDKALVRCVAAPVIDIRHANGVS